MHVVTNAGIGGESYGWWVDLICKGTGTQIRHSEKDL
jgi:hypothetical protein